MAERLGLLGGTFDPPHIGHLVLAECAREQLSLARVLFIPAGMQWRKTRRDISDADHRVAMVRLAIGGNPDFQLSTIEVDRPGPSYTADTLADIAREYADTELFLVLGEDALADLPRWRDPERIVEQAVLAVAGRLEAALERREPRPGLEARIVRVQMPLLEISATGIRDRVRAGRSIRYLVPRAVEEYIDDQSLYR